MYFILSLVIPALLLFPVLLVHNATAYSLENYDTAVHVDYKHVMSVDDGNDIYIFDDMFSEEKHIPTDYPERYYKYAILYGDYEYCPDIGDTLE